MFKLPNWTRPFVGTIAGAVATVVSAILLQKVPLLAPYINPETVSATVVTWVGANMYKTLANAKINPTNASTGALAASVPANTVSKDSVLGKEVKNVAPITPTGK